MDTGSSTASRKRRIGGLLHYKVTVITTTILFGVSLPFKREWEGSQTPVSL